MTRKASLITLVCVFGLSVLTTQAFGKTITLSYANYPPAIAFPCIQMERWADEVEKRTQGKVKIETFPGSTLLGAKGMVRGVMTGQADIGVASLSLYAGAFPTMGLFELPLGYGTARASSMAAYSVYKKFNPKELSKFKVLAVFTSGPSNVLSRKPVRTLDDFKGLELRATGTFRAKAISILGGAPVSLSMNEVPEAIQKGVIQGLVSSFDVIKDMNFAETCKYNTYTNFAAYPWAVLMNMKTWNSLPEDVQKVMDDMAFGQSEWTGNYLDEHMVEAIEWGKKKFDIEMIRLSKADQEKMDKMLEPLFDEWAEKVEKKGLDAKAVIDYARECIKKYETQ